MSRRISLFLTLMMLVVSGWLVVGNSSASTLAPAATPAPESALFLPVTMNAGRNPQRPIAIFSAFVPDGLALRDADEGFAIQNVGAGPLFLGGWHVTDGEGTLTLPDLVVSPGQEIWCTRQAVAFEKVWAQTPACEYQSDTDPDVPNASGTIPDLNNNGDELQLFAPDGVLADAVVYEQGDVTIDGWTGQALQPYQPSNSFGSEGQVYYRLFRPATGLPALPDSDTVTDWAQGNRNPLKGRRTAYPGWTLHRLAQPLLTTWSQPRAATVLVTPDNAFSAIRDLFASAQTSILLETYELTHPGLVAALAGRAQAGVTVHVLLEGGPVGGLTDETRWAAQQLSLAGVRVHFMVNDVDDAHDRYPYQHSKFAIIDGRTLLLSTENFKPSSMPEDAADGETLGRRGYAVIIEDPDLAARAALIYTLDDDDAYTDIFPWQADHATYGSPPPGYTPPPAEDLQGYRVRFPQPLHLTDATAAALFTSPETSLYPSPLLDLINRAGPGDVILTQQLYEHPYWGATDSNASDDPNVRLEALIAAARRGASVRILLDSFFDYPYKDRSNLNTVNYVNDIAHAEGLDLIARRGNPAGAGLHAKLHLLALGDKRWVVAASMNGSEASNKLNREMGLALQSAQAYDYLKGVFDADWRADSLQTAVPDAWRSPD